MNDFIKSKIAFAIALLATLFTISPLITNVGSIGFKIFGFNTSIQVLVNSVSAILALAVYFYGIQFLTEKPLKYTLWIADIMYAIAIILPPFFMTLFIISRIVEFVEPYINTYIITNILSFISAVISTLEASKIVNNLKNREKKSTVESLENKELLLIERARKYYESGDYDIAVTECYKAIETSLRKSLLTLS